MDTFYARVSGGKLSLRCRRKTVQTNCEHGWNSNQRRPILFFIFYFIILPCLSLLQDPKRATQEREKAHKIHHLLNGAMLLNGRLIRAECKVQSETSSSWRAEAECLLVHRERARAPMCGCALPFDNTTQSEGTMKYQFPGIAFSPRRQEIK